MRVVALGAAGAMGRRAAQTVASFDHVDELVIADYSMDGAERVAAELGPKARAISVDVTDAVALTGLLEPADVVLNTVGPFYRFGVPILRAAIAARTHYLDINDDWEPTIDMLALADEARTAGVTAIIGMGASPGVSNLLAAHAAAELDELDSLITGWGVGGTDSLAQQSEEEVQAPSAAVVHWMHQCSGRIRVLREREFRDVPPVEAIEIDFPQIGKAEVYSVGHPEAVTLPRIFPGLRECVNVMVIERWQADMLRQLGAQIDAGSLSEEDAARLLLSGDSVRAALEAGSSDLPGTGLPPLFALAQGRSGGREARVGTFVLGAPATGMAGATGVPLAIGADLLARGVISNPGVFTPEQVIDPSTFFDELAPLCDPIFASSAELVPVLKSG
ncbi:MAG: saccharopine dehydrogenase [bacterium]|nr:saccharopine dehydrogenase [bacterium]